MGGMLSISGVSANLTAGVPAFEPAGVLVLEPRWPDVVVSEMSHIVAMTFNEMIGRIRHTCRGRRIRRHGLVGINKGKIKQ